MKIQKILIFLALISQSLQTINRAKLEQLLKNVQNLEKPEKKENKPEIQKKKANKKDRNLLYLGGYNPLIHPTLTGMASFHSALGPYHNAYPYYGLGAHPLNLYNGGLGGYPGYYPGMFPGLTGMNMFSPFGYGGMGYNPFFINNLMPHHGVLGNSDPSDPHDFRKLSVDNVKK